MEKIIRIVKKGHDESNLNYWLSLSGEERISELEKIRYEVNKRFYGNTEGFKRVCRIVKRTRS